MISYDGQRYKAPFLLLLPATLASLGNSPDSECCNQLALLLKHAKDDCRGFRMGVVILPEHVG